GGLTRAGAVMGTPEYMSPEQFRGEGVDARSDLYALGIMLFEMLSGSLPFMTDSVIEYARMHAFEPPPSFADRSAVDVAPELEAIVRRLLEKSQADRFGSAREVIDALRAVPQDKRGSAGVSVPPPSAVPEPICGAAAAERIHGAIQVGAPTYNAGDHGGC